MNKTVKFVVSTFAFASILLLSGCASMFGDNTRTVIVNSTPEGAGVYINNQQYGVTPTSVTLPSYIYGGKVITIKKEGYADQSAMINTSFQPVGLLNLLFWPGFLIDAATGDTVKIDPATRNIFATLEPATAVSASAAPTAAKSK